ncbi:Zinc finger protein ZAT5 [Platanthera guangdongensis]|uniref:Zinc finger protein ZAT5 n=1 Tax=Platanthera guangdongensis TaxID=2320717 RepID=A0ABR2LUM4_9ASPA
MAGLLLLLSGDGDDKETPKLGSAAKQPEVGRLFACKSCGRKFATFQALGGHRASHKRPRVEGEREPPGGKLKAHECSVCGLEFAVGQALGGHMRRHRAAAAAAAEGENRKKLVWMDLNLTPTENDLVMRKVWIPVVDCLY